MTALQALVAALVEELGGPDQVRICGEVLGRAFFLAMGLVIWCGCAIAVAGFGVALWQLVTGDW